MVLDESILLCTQQTSGIQLARDVACSAIHGSVFLSSRTALTFEHAVYKQYLYSTWVQDINPRLEAIISSKIRPVPHKKEPKTEWKRGLCPRTPVFVGLWASPGLRLMIAVGKYFFVQKILA